MFNIRIESKQIPNKRSPVVSGYHGKNGFTLEPEKAKKYKTYFAAERVAEGLNLDNGYGYSIEPTSKLAITH